jgi:hypothetical protein
VPSQGIARTEAALEVRTATWSSRVRHRPHTVMSTGPSASSPAERTDRSLGPCAASLVVGAHSEAAAPIKRPVFPAVAEPHPCAELTAVCHGSRRRGTRAFGRPHRRPTHSEPSLAPTQATTTCNRTTLPHTSPERWPQWMPQPGAAACLATGPLDPKLRSK